MGQAIARRAAVPDAARSCSPHPPTDSCCTPGRAVPIAPDGFIVASSRSSTRRRRSSVCTLVRERGGGVDARAARELLHLRRLGLCIGSLGLRGRSVGLFADVIAGGLLIVSGANVPLGRLPEVVQSASSFVPLTHGIEAARSVACGADLSSITGLLGKEVAIGAVYLSVRSRARGALRARRPADRRPGPLLARHRFRPCNTVLQSVPWVVGEIFDDRLGRPVSEGNVQQYVSDSRQLATRPELANEQTDSLVARLRESELACDRSEPSVDLCDRLLSIVEPCDGCDQPGVQPRSR